MGVKNSNIPPKTIQVIGIDHGWQNMKTSTTIFTSGVKEMSTEPIFPQNVLEYKNKYYVVGGKRLEVQDTKVQDDNYYFLTLAAIAKELQVRNIKKARAFLGVGLPLTRFATERDEFLKYLNRDKDINFKFEGVNYNISLEKILIFPQCYAAVAENLESKAHNRVVVDIGSWTVDIMPISSEGLPIQEECQTLPYGFIRCMSKINAICIQQYNCEIPEDEILEYIEGKSSLEKKYQVIIKTEIENWIKKILGLLRQFGFTPQLNDITILGGGSLAFEKFSEINKNKNVTFIRDIRANAKGYEYLVKRSKAYRDR